MKIQTYNNKIMDLQNIVVNFETIKVQSFYTNKVYKIPVITNMVALQGACNTETGFTVAFIIVQYTVDQYGQGAEPRIIVSDGDGENEQRVLLPLSSISTGLADELAITRVEVETEITNQIA